MFCAHSRVDPLALRGVEVSRVQCKTAPLEKKVLGCRTCSNTNTVPRSYPGEVDAFGPTANNETKGVRFAGDYEMGRRHAPTGSPW